MTCDFDLIVIDAGMAGVSAANKCASKGWKVAIVDTPQHQHRGSSAVPPISAGAEVGVIARAPVAPPMRRWV